MTNTTYVGKISPILKDNWTDNVPSYYSYYDYHQRRKAAKKKLKRERAIFFFVAVALAFMCFATFSVSGISRETFTSNLCHAVESGDTLWSIAEEYKGENVSTGDFVRQLKKINEMKTSEIYVGQLLIIPE
ncbi:MAG: LysM peptidoglycan-binding domain-containing protein [Clostridia bacterium]